MKFLNVCHVVVVIGLLSVLGFTECQQQCVNNNSCPSNQACMNQRCVDPCLVVCGSNTNCMVSNHSPICSCLPGYTGDPFIGCTPGRKCGVLGGVLCLTQCLLSGTPTCVDGQCVCTAT